MQRMENECLGKSEKEDKEQHGSSLFLSYVLQYTYWSPTESISTWAANQLPAAAALAVQLAAIISKAAPAQAAYWGQSQDIFKGSVSQKLRPRLLYIIRKLSL